MDLINFFPIYPEINKTSFQEDIGRKGEFAKYRLEERESQPYGNKYNHQNYLSRFMSGHNNYDELVLYHDMGTGKTTTAISIAESLLKDNSIKHVYILSRGENLMKSFQKELATIGTNNKYAPRDFKEEDGIFYQDGDEITSTMFYIRIKKLYSKYYTFDTYHKFMKKIYSRRLSRSDINKMFSNCLFIMDEIHNVKDNDTEVEIDYYKEYKKIFDIIDYRKILLLSGTLMIDKPNELSSIMNLLLRDKTIVSGAEFDKRYLNDRNVEELGSLIKGRISYLKNMKSNVSIEYEGQVMEPLKSMVLYSSMMSKHQSFAYMDKFKGDKGRDSVFVQSRKASIYVDGEEFVNTLRKHSDVNVVMEIIKEYSCKYYEIMKNILENEGENTFIFQFFVSDKSINNQHFYVIRMCLTKIGLVEFKPVEGLKITGMKKRQRYAVITSKTSPGDSKLIERIYNSPQNKHGEYIRVVLGSDAISEGISFKNVQQIHIVNPYWNNGKLSQSIYRGIRLNSHKDLENPKVKIYQHVATVHKDIKVVSKETEVIEEEKENDDDDDDDDLDDWLTEITNKMNELNIKVNIPKVFNNSIDLYMYKTTENKKNKIDKVNKIIEQYAVDKYITYKRNNTRVDEGKLVPVDKSSQQMWYTEDYMEQIVKFLELYFSNKFSINIQVLCKSFSTLGNFQLMIVINKIIIDNHIFINKNGIKSYMRYNNNYLFIVSNIRSKESFLESYYNKNIILQQKINMSSYTEQIELKSNLSAWETIVEGDIEKSKKSLSLIKPNYQCDILEQVIVTKKRVELKNLIMEYYKHYLFVLDGKKIHNILKMSYQGPLRQLVKETWIDVDDPDVILLINKQIVNRYANITGHYGIYNNSKEKINVKTFLNVDGEEFHIDNFKIRDISNAKKLTSTTGIVCKSALKRKLIKLAMKMDLSKYIISNTDYKREDFTTKSLKDVGYDLLVEEMGELKQSDINKLYYYGKEQKSVLIIDIYRYYKEQELLVMEI